MTGRRTAGRLARPCPSSLFELILVHVRVAAAAAAACAAALCVRLAVRGGIGCADVTTHTAAACGVEDRLQPPPKVKRAEGGTKGPVREGWRG